jgi:aspartate racemase
MAVVHRRRTLTVTRHFMATPITRSARLEGSLWVGQLDRSEWGEEQLADLLEARRATEEMLRLAGRHPAEEVARPDPREVIGVLGGMGPAASAEFLATLTRLTPASRDQDHLRVLVDSNPQIPDRTAFLLGRGPDPRPALVTGARGLRRAGATCLVVPCNTANIFAPHLAQRVRLSIVPWIPTATAAVPGRGPGGIMAPEGKLRKCRKQRALRLAGRTAVLPTDVERAELMGVIYAGAKKGASSRGDRAALVAVALAMAERGAEHLLLACTEIPLVLSADADAWPVPATDPAIAVARRLTRTHEPEDERSVTCSSTTC